MAVDSVGTSTTGIFAKSNDAKNTLADNFDTFLTLLTTQLKNQDPSSPMDNAEFTQQLALFSQVEQSIKANDNLETLVGLSKSSSGAVGYLGKYVVAEGNEATLADGQTVFLYDLGVTAQKAELQIMNSSGQVVAKVAAPTALGRHAVTWDGISSSGVDLADGTYSFKVVATGFDGKDIANTTYSSGVVTGIDLGAKDGDPVLEMGGINVQASKVISIYDKAAIGESS